LTAPAQLSATGVTTSVEGFFASLARVRTLEQDVRRSSDARNDQLEAENNTLREVETENEQLLRNSTLPRRARAWNCAARRSWPA
jgi:rod shape-determining protein MreC